MPRRAKSGSLMVAITQRRGTARFDRSMRPTWTAWGSHGPMSLGQGAAIRKPRLFIPLAFSTESQTTALLSHWTQEPAWNAGDSIRKSIARLRPARQTVVYVAGSSTEGSL